VEAGHFVEQRLRIDNAAGTDDILRARVENTAWNQVQRVFSVFVDYGMAGIVAALKPNDDIRLLRQVIDDPPFSFIAPLCADYGCNWHTFILLSGN
jgi:hypothetical protein